MNKPRWKVWLQAARLRTLPLACAAVLLGSGLAAGADLFQMRREEVDHPFRPHRQPGDGVPPADGQRLNIAAAKAAAAQQKAAAYPENQTRPEGGQGGLFGVGRIIVPGDKDYNRGSLNPKLH